MMRSLSLFIATTPPADPHGRTVCWDGLFGIEATVGACGVPGVRAGAGGVFSSREAR